MRRRAISPAFAARCRGREAPGPRTGLNLVVARTGSYDVLGADGERLGVLASLGITLDEWVQGRLGGYVRLRIPERREAVAELTAEV
jgi:hypothetical protein